MIFSPGFRVQQGVVVAADAGLHAVGHRLHLGHDGRHPPPRQRRLLPRRERHRWHPQHGRRRQGDNYFMTLLNLGKNFKMCSPDLRSLGSVTQRAFGGAPDEGDRGGGASHAEAARRHGGRGVPGLLRQGALRQTLHLVCTDLSNIKHVFKMLK